LKEHTEWTGADGGPLEFRHLSDQDLDAQIARLLAELGLVEQIDAVTGQPKLRHVDNVKRDRHVDDIKPDTPLLKAFGDADIHKA
jgi:ribosomal protein L29